MRRLSLVVNICFITTLLISCESDRNKEIVLGEFGAFYTKINSNEPFEAFSRVGNYADIVVDLGDGQSSFVFWRGSSYLPYLETPQGRFYVDEVIERSGDGTEQMPDKANTYSRIKLVKNTDDEIIVHWRYLPKFAGTNPHTGVSPLNFVDEYFNIYPNSKVTRTIKSGTEKVADWRSNKSLKKQSFELTSSGIANSVLEDVETKPSTNNTHVATIIDKSPVRPKLWLRFDEGENYSTKEESASQKEMPIIGDALWRTGVSGTSLQFDGYRNELKVSAQDAPAINNQITLEGWVALAAYPWNDVPLIQQVDDNPETALMVFEGDTIVKTKEVFDQFEAEERDFEVILKEENDKGYFLGIDAYGKPKFKLRINNKTEELIADNAFVERYQWHQLTGTYDGDNGLMSIYVNGKLTEQKKVSPGKIITSSNDIRIGRGKDRRPTRTVRMSTYFSDTYCLDGLIDEIKIYDIALSASQVAATYQNYSKGGDALDTVNMDKRVLPDGKNSSEFGAYYSNLAFHDVYDNFWRFSDHTDVVVEFDEMPTKFVFWKGTGYIPMLVNESGQWYSNEFNETWNRSGGIGCQEPMSDKTIYSNHVRIIENTPARTVVHWRYPLWDVFHYVANYNEDTGWGDWSDWYYYIYPDGVAVKSMTVWTNGIRDHEFQESMAIFGPDQHPEDIIHTKEALSMYNLKGDTATYNWIGGPPENVEKPDNKSIQYINYTGEYKPVTIGEFIDSNVYGGELTEYSVFPSWNHWPVAQMASDGRNSTFSDRTAHSSLTHLFMPIYKEDKKGSVPSYQQLLMEGMMNLNSEDLVLLANSWLNAPQISDVEGGTGKYDPAQRAYVIEANPEGTIKFSVNASAENPTKNLAIVVKHWGNRGQAKAQYNNKSVTPRQGTFRDTDGTKTLVIWISENSKEKISITLNPE
ncbi:LamG domain-containing protein [Flagellimonas sp. CMM7]|uniref:LamG domain-containing protein n=1 Tax=Flagellimonas sp. CMM7 TaxID=2654676 RepID=UPI0013D06323|nr:LamG domain-containing protein [Flagellimonas sp. CMM7]UII79853.1 LamG domain-containing protein [Flagellimonas sp. CMM7]